MGGVPIKHHSKSKVGRRRSQQALKRRVFVACPNCKSPALPHRTCAHCGTMVLAPKTRTAPRVKDEVKKEAPKKEETPKEEPREETKEEGKEEVKPEVEEKKAEEKVPEEEEKEGEKTRV